MKAFLKHAGLLLLTCAALVGCGGTGDSSEGGTDGGGTTPTVTVSVQIYDPNGNVTSSVTTSSPGTVRATVRNNGAAVSGVVVTFETSHGTLNPSSGTALTDSSGVAEITLNAGTAAGAGVVKASVTNPADAEGERAFSTSVTTNTVSMNLTVSNANVSAGGTTTLTATLTNSDGSPFTTVLPVNFTSQCSTNGTAVIDNPVNTNNGVAVSTYRAQGCVGADTVTATVTAGTLQTDTVGLTVAPATVGSITFISATPEKIAIRGTGGVGRSETSTIRFQVRDAQGNPVPNQRVDFSLNLTTGGISLTPTQANSDINGFVQTVVTAGTVATSVKVTAVVNATTISTQSENLVIEAGLPDQDSFSLSASRLNPEAWSIDGVEVTVTARLADAYNNPVPDGTSVYFTAEGGSIEPSCETANGACSVKWRSQNPRPIGGTCGAIPSTNNAHFVTDSDGDGVADTTENTAQSCLQPYGGRATILARAVGEESFRDLNGNGVLDTTDESDLFLTGTDVGGNAFDLSEAFVDENEDGKYRNATGADTTNGVSTAGAAGTDNSSWQNETFFDFGGGVDGAPNGQFDLPDGFYNGSLCTNAALPVCAAARQKSINVRQSLVLVMADSGFFIEWDRASVDVTGQSSAQVCVVIADFHNQPPPFATTVKFETNNGTLTGTPAPMGNTSKNGGVTYCTLIKGDSTSSSGVMTVTVTAPSATASLNSITVND